MADPFDTPGYRFASQTFAGDGSTIDWNFSFAGRSPGYISVDHVRAELIDDTTGEVTPLVLTPEQFVLPTRLRIEPAVPVGTTLRVWRDTPKDQPMLDYTDGALMIEKNLDTSNEQGVYATAEMVDRFADALDETAEFSQAVLDRLGEVETTANQAADDAQDAVNTANAATATAQGAVNTANAAVETAADALAGVEGATIAAQQATEAADAANQAADTANQAVIDVTAIAATAEQNATAALSVANGIDAKAQEALDNSELAITTADAAETTANGIAGTAASAVTIAEAAADDASEALTTANGIADTAADALTAAGEAQTAADNAASAAAAAQTAADNAQDTADDALARAEISVPVYSTRPTTNAGPIVYVQGLGIQYWNGSAYRSDFMGDPEFPSPDWPQANLDSTITSVPSTLRPGVYRATGSHSGLPSGWTQATLEVEMYNNNTAIVTATCNAPASLRGTKATRVYGTGVAPTAWRLMYSQNNIIGDVSQSSEVPTGSLFERTVSGTKVCLRSADGTQICRHRYTAPSVNMAIYDTITVQASGDAFLKEFTQIEGVSGMVVGPGTANAPYEFQACLRSVSNTALGIVELTRHGNSNGSTRNPSGCTLYIEATGRWF